MDNHKKIEELLTEFALGHLSEEKMNEINQHIQSCDKCAEQLRNLQNLLALTEQIRNTKVSEEFCAKARSRLFSSTDIADNIQGRIKKLPLTWRKIMNNPITKYAVAAVILIAVTVAIATWNRTEPPVKNIADTTTTQPNSQNLPKSPAFTIATDNNSPEYQLDRAKEFFAAANVDGLIQMLDNPQYEAKVAAANYLAKLGDSNALPALEALAEQYDNPENPFKKAAIILSGEISIIPQDSSTTGTEQIEHADISNEIMDLLPADTLFCVRINNFDNSLGQMDRYISGLAPMPMPATTMVRIQLANLLADSALVNVETKSNFAVFGIILPGTEGDKIKDLFVGAILPMKDYDQFVDDNINCTSPDTNDVSVITSAGKKRLLSRLGNFAVVPLFGNYNQLLTTIKFLAEDKKVLSQSLSIAEVKLAKEQPLWAYCSIRHSADIFIPAAQEKIDQLEKLVAQQQQKTNQPAPPPQALNFYRALLDIIAEESDYVSLSIAPSNEILTLHITSQAMPDTPLARMFASGKTPKEQNKLLHLLPESAVLNVAMRMNTPFWEELTLTNYDLISLMSDKEMPAETTDKIQQAIFDMISACGGDGIMSLVTVPDSNEIGFGAEYIVEVSDPQKWEKTNEELMNLWTQSGLQDIYSDNFGLDTEYQISRAVEEYKGVKIDSAFFALKSTDPNSEYGKMVTNIYGQGGIAYRWAFIDNLYVNAIGGDCQTRIHNMIDKVQNPTSTQIPLEFSKATSLLSEPNDYDLLGTFNYMRILSMASTFMPGPMKDVFAQADLQSNSNIIFGSKHAKGCQNIQIIIPKDHLMEIYNTMKTIKPALNEAQKQMQQEQSQLQEPNNPVQSGE